MNRQRFTPGEEDLGRRLDVALAGWLEESRSSAAARIERGEISVDGAPAKRSHRLEGGEVVHVQPPPETPTGAQGVAPPPIRYEDEHLLVVSKPAGLVVHPGVGNTAGTLVQALEEAGVALAPAGGATRPGIVHRLDRDTSGLLIVAKSDEAYHGLVDALRRRDVQRRYLALVEGAPGGPVGRIEVPIGRHPGDRRRFSARQDGRSALTTWEAATSGSAAGTEVSLLRLALGTGRTHQIRVHVSYMGNPVVGDTTYGADPGVAAELGLERPFLHAHRLGFTHPVTGRPVELEEPLPDDLLAAADAADVEI